MSSSSGPIVLLAIGLLSTPHWKFARRLNSGLHPVSARQFELLQKQTDRAAPVPQHEQGKISRLILKDGTYEAIQKYEIKGDRVRFLSSERHEWEEMPASLVDWPATERYAREAESTRQSRLNQLNEAETRERAEAESSNPTVAPGIRLPDTGGVFLLDVFQGIPELNELHQNGADVKKNVAGNILRGVINPVAGTRQTIELAGLHAKTQSHITEPSIYINIDSGEGSATNYTAENAKAHFRIVRCEEKKGNRIVGVVNIAVYGKVKERTDSIEIRADPFPGNWIKVTPQAPLSAGEYALVELLEEKGINTLVWDFGVDPAAPANMDARKSEPAKPNKPPELLIRKKRQQSGL